MKFFKSFIIFYQFFSFFIAINSNGLHEIEKTNLNEFLDQLQSKPGIADRSVKVDDGVSSINEFFNPKKDKVNQKWQITEQGVYRTGYIIHLVVSCEYSEYTYNLVQIIAYAITKLGYHIKSDKNRQNIQDYFYRPIRDVLSNMILTLVGLINYTKDYCLKHHEILNIILSWYVYIMQSDYVEYDSQGKPKIYHIDYTNMINNQIERYLKIFNINNCRSIEDFEKNKANFETQLNQLNTINEFQNLIQKKVTELNPLFFDKFLKKPSADRRLFILPPSNRYTDGIRSLINRQTSLQRLEVKWDSRTSGDFESIYNDLISKKASGIFSILKIEKIFLESITKIIMAFISNELNKLIQDSQLDEEKLTTDMQNKLIDFLDGYIQKFKDDGQPIYLINNMSIIKAEIWNLCNAILPFDDKLTEVGRYMAKLNKLKIDIPDDFGLTEFKAFMNGLMRSVIFVKFHPLVTNAFWEKLYFAPTKISDYVIDLKYLHKTFEVIPTNDKVTCPKLSIISGKLRGIETQIKSCEYAIGLKNQLAISTAFNNLNSQYSKLKSKIDETVSILDGLYSFNWRKLLLSVVYNIDNIRAFAANEKERNIALNDLKILQWSISGFFDVGFYVTCNSLPVFQPGNDTELTSSSNTRSQNEYREMSLRLVDTRAYKDLFKTINAYMGEIVKENIEHELALYWDGIRMTIGNVYEMFKLYSLDQLQENYDYLKFLVRWLLSVVYYKISEICYAIISTNNSYLPPTILSKLFFINDLEIKLKDFQKLPLFISMPIGPILNRFIIILKTQNDINDGLNDYMGVLNQELEDLGFIPPSTRYTNNRTYSVYIQLLIKTISDLVRMYEKHKNIIENSATLIDVDLNDRIMMFNAWN